MPYTKFHNQAGIAIGPILFIIAILAILAAAIAAGSTAFTGGTNKESAKAKATAIIEMGQNLKLGWDRITANGIAPANIIIDPAQTTASNHMFSPAGGGISPPSNVFADNGYIWGYFISNLVPDTGQYSAAVLAVSSDVCQEINRQLFGASILPSTGSYDLIIDSPFYPDDLTQVVDIVTITWPTGVPKGNMAFCVIGVDSTNIQRFFFIQYFVL